MEPVVYFSSSFPVHGAVRQPQEPFSRRQLSSSLTTGNTQPGNNSSSSLLQGWQLPTKMIYAFLLEGKPIVIEECFLCSVTSKYGAIILQYDSTLSLKLSHAYQHLFPDFWSCDNTCCCEISLGWTMALSMRLHCVLSAQYSWKILCNFPCTIHLRTHPWTATFLFKPAVFLHASSRPLSPGENAFWIKWKCQGSVLRALQMLQTASDETGECRICRNLLDYIPNVLLQYRVKRFRCISTREFGSIPAALR